jgi:TRAP-type uncharacterized transport system substrate-binding protein
MRVRSEAVPLVLLLTSAPGTAFFLLVERMSRLECWSIEQTRTTGVWGAVRVALFTAFIAAAGFGGQVEQSVAQTRRSASHSETAGVSLRKEKPPDKDSGLSENRQTLGLVTGEANSTESAIAADLAATIASGQETGPHGEVALRVLPMVGNGGTRNITDVLTLAGADMAIAPVLLVDRLRGARTYGDISGKLVYITPLYIEEFHLLARPEIRSLADLAGKSVNLGEQGSASALLGREVLNSFGVKVDEVNLGLDAALDGMQKGQIVATLMVSGKPVKFLADALQVGGQGQGLHFLPIPYSPALQHDYLPSSLGDEDYPNVIPSGAKIDTIAIKSALFAYKWPPRSERSRLMEYFVDTFFSRLPEFRGDTHHPKWRELNLAEQIPGWQRFRPAERWVQQHSDGDVALRDAFDRFLQRNPVPNVQDREQLFQQFLRWRERQQDK